MSNLGFRVAMRQAGIDVVETPVGGQYILKAMADGGYVLGGEQSGYIVLRKYSTTGDGLLTALQLLAVVARRQEPLANLASVMTRYPQVTKDVPADRSQIASPQLADAISAVEEDLGDSGRVLIRPSGTEDVVRVTVQDEDPVQAERIATELAYAVAAL
jgi:phosphoglucosamine mutase